MSLFDAARFPLHGRRLIEASAGTGKTYNIANLYLRLLLGDGCEAKTVEQILVVTFTRAATNELRGRIRAKVEMALETFRGSKNHEGYKDDFILDLLARQQSASTQVEACRLLNDALLHMDEACIFTIHGFAVRAIQVFLFETGALANVEISETGNARREQVLSDVWRELQLTRNETLRAYTDALDIRDRKKFIDYFSANYAQAAILPEFRIQNASQPLDILLKQVEQRVALETKKADEARKRLSDQWQQICKNTSVTELKSALGDSGNSKLFEKLDNLVMPGGKMLQRMMAIHNSDAQDELAVFIRDFVRHVESIVDTESLMKSLFRALLLQYLRVKMATINMESMQLDEVVSLINQILQEGGLKAAQLRGMVTSTYPICMVDEFQDTDPAQFEMFNQLYSYKGSDSFDTGFFMIGDPKQSIYQFRGADIFSYLSVRRQVQHQEIVDRQQHIFSLDTNFRSKKELITVTNKLFAEKPDVDKTLPRFVFPGIDYVDVKSCETLHNIDKGQYSTGDKSIPNQALVFIGNDSNDEKTANEKINGETLRWKYANDTAQRIAALLDAKNGGKINGTAMRGGDIAVLVRTAREANAIRAALLAQNPRIGSVFQSQRDSIFKCSLIADDIYHLLCAMDDPKDKHLLKKVMATLLYRGFSLDFSDLDALDAEGENSDMVFEKLIIEFEEYRQCWEKYGVLVAINRFASRHGLMKKMAQLPDCDRLVTDLRHFGEILQSKYLQCSSREELIIWFGRQLKDDSDMEEDVKRIRLESDENLVKIVTIHVSKGLEYPVVFLPFFFLPWTADISKKMPLYHPDPDFQACVDFSLDRDTLTTNIQKEMLAEDMRLFYVAITRAIFQCYIGISAATHAKKPVFDKTVWSHLLAIEDKQPNWPQIRQALMDKLGNSNIAYRQLFDLTVRTTDSVVTDATADLMPCVSGPNLPTSNWVITSYSALAHARKEPGIRRGGADEVPLMPALDQIDPEIQDTELQKDNIRYRLKGSSRTGDCLHGFYEHLALDPQRYLANENATTEFDLLLQRCLRQHGLEKPEDINLSYMTDAEKEKLYSERRQELAVWLSACLHQPLMMNDDYSTLHELFINRQVLPEMDFDFSIGSTKPAKIRDGINKALHTMNVEGVYVPDHSELEGLVTGSIDLLFIHNKKVYVLDYKSNTLGKAPRYYDQFSMTQAMKENRYDLQYLIYSVAAHRYMQQRLGTRYRFDASSKDDYSFGGVMYLFLRGMGLDDPACRQHGIWFHRPKKAEIEMLDVAFKGGL